MKLLLDMFLVLVISSGIETVISVHFELLIRDMLYELFHEFEDMFSNFNVLTGFMIVIPIFDLPGFLVQENKEKGMQHLLHPKGKTIPRAI